MPIDQTPDIAVWREQAQPELNRLFALSYAITGRKDASRVALTDALLDAYVQRAAWVGRMSFQDGLKLAVVHASRDEASRADSAPDWDCLTMDNTHIDALTPEVDASIILSCYDAEIRRALCMKYAINMQDEDIARALKMHAADVKNMLSRAVAELGYALNVKRRAAEGWIGAQCDAAISYDNGFDAAYIWEIFEREAGKIRTNRRITAADVWVFVLRAALIGGLCALFYLAAILIDRPTSLTRDSSQLIPPQIGEVTSGRLTMRGLRNGASEMQFGTDLTQAERYFTLPYGTLPGYTLRDVRIRDAQLNGGVLRILYLTYEKYGQILCVSTRVPGQAALSALREGLSPLNLTARFLGADAPIGITGRTLHTMTLNGDTLCVLDGEVSDDVFLAAAEAAVIHP